MNELRIILPLLCRSKKNSQQIYINKKTGRRFVTQSDLYKNFEQECGMYLRNFKYKINEPINLKCTFYVPDKRKRDIVNLLNAIQDVLVKFEVIKDDDYSIVKSLDGTRIIYEKGREETIIEISEVEE